MYSQKDEPQADLFLGNSPYQCKGYGCTVTAIAQALTLAGWNITPYYLILKMNEIGGFTGTDYTDGPGLIIWSKVSEAYPQFHFGGEGYTFQQGVLGHFKHWVLKHDGQVYDPLYALNQDPRGFEETSRIRTASIDMAPRTVPVIQESVVSAVHGGRVRNDHSTAKGTATGSLVNNGDNIEYSSIVSGTTPDGETESRWLKVTKINGVGQAESTYLWAGLFNNL